VILLADTSLSMSLTDSEGGKSTGGASRAAHVAAALGDGRFLNELRKTHEVAVARFDQDLGRITLLPKRHPAAGKAMGRDTPGTARDPVPGATSDGGKSDSAGDGADIAWEKQLTPTGPETRLGQAILESLQGEHSSSLAGIVVFSDGGQNAGVAPDAAIQAAREAKVPIFPVGIGSRRQLPQVRVVDLAAPLRAYSGDKYTVTGYVQAQKLGGRLATIELLSRDASSGTAHRGADHLEASQPLVLGGDGEVVPVRFELMPDHAGRHTLTLRVKVPGADPGASEVVREADVEIVDHKNHILLLAGGPQHEYQLLRNLLYRDHTCTLDVLLQTAQPGISQEAAKLLDAFPDSREAMFAYDCVIAIDPDWQALSAAQIDLLEKWVAEQGGGLIVAAGPVYAGRSVNSWIQDPAMSKIRALYPVSFYSHGAMLDEGSYQGKDPWPLNFTREGLAAEYLWLEDSAGASHQAWSSFPGVFSFFPVKGEKIGAAVLARFGESQSGQSAQPVYFATQFYGAGRVFYMGSAEMRRLRGVADSYFEKFYTKLIRHVSQGRLLRGSSRGVLLVGRDRDYLVGNTVEVRAQLSNAQFEPLLAKSVEVQVFGPGGEAQTISLSSDRTRAGTFAGHFVATREGPYRLELAVLDGGDQRLTRRIQVDLPQSELKDPLRNDQLLSRIARETAGRYYVGTEKVLAVGAPDALVRQLKDRTKTVVKPLGPDRWWDEFWRRWIMYLLGGLLCLEWLLRRLFKLA
jgi:hypothetical protein